MSGLTPEQRKALGYALYEYPLGSPQLEDAIRRLTPVVENLLAAEREAGAAEVRARIETVHGRYFDLDGEPGHDDTTPEPEDVWRYDRDLRAAMNGGE